MASPTCGQTWACSHVCAWLTIFTKKIHNLTLDIGSFHNLAGQVCVSMQRNAQGGPLPQRSLLTCQHGTYGRKVHIALLRLRSTNCMGCCCQQIKQISKLLQNYHGNKINLMMFFHKICALMTLINKISNNCFY